MLISFTGGQNPTDGATRHNTQPYTRYLSETILFHVCPCAHVEGSAHLPTARRWRSGQLSRFSSDFPCGDKVSHFIPASVQLTMQAAGLHDFPVEKQPWL